MTRLNVIDTIEYVLEGGDSSISPATLAKIQTDPHWILIRKQLKNFGKTCYEENSCGTTGDIKKSGKHEREIECDVTEVELEEAFLKYGFATEDLHSAELVPFSKFDLTDRPWSSREILVGKSYFVDHKIHSAMDIGYVTDCITVCVNGNQSDWVRCHSVVVDETIVDDYYSACRVEENEYYLVPALCISRPCDILPPNIGQSNLGMYNRLSIINGCHVVS